MAVGAGVGAHGVGRQFAAGNPPSTTLVSGVTVVCFLGLCWTAGKGITGRLSRIEPEFLLTTVPVREVVTGALLLSYARIGARTAPPVVAGAVGFGLGARSPASSVAIVFAAVGLVALAIVTGAAIGLALAVAAARSPRLRRFRNVMQVLAFVLGLAAWSVVSAAADPVALVAGWLAPLPPAWFVDVALIGAPAVSTELGRAAGAAATLAVGLPILALAATSLAAIRWTTEPVGSVREHRPRSLVAGGVSDKLLGTSVSRPVLTVARKRWLQERRVPRAAWLFAAVVLWAVTGVSVYALDAGRIPAAAPAIVAVACAIAIGVAFGMTPIGTEYQGLKLTLTAIPGREFVRGTVLAGVGVGAPVSVIVAAILGIAGGLGVPETAAVAVAGVALCTCAVTVGVALGMRADYFDFMPMPMPMSSATVFAEVGRWSFYRPGIALGVASVLAVPAVLAFAPGFAGSVSSASGLPHGIVRIAGSALSTAGAVGTAVVAYRHAVAEYEDYRLG